MTDPKRVAIRLMELDFRTKTMNREKRVAHRLMGHTCKDCSHWKYDGYHPTAGFCRRHPIEYLPRDKLPCPQFRIRPQKT